MLYLSSAPVIYMLQQFDYHHDSQNTQIFLICPNTLDWVLDPLDFTWTPKNYFLHF